jgi:hypothetical protein
MTPEEIKVHPDLAALMADPATVEAALATLRALQNLQVVVNIGGRQVICTIKITGESAVIDITAPDASA